MPSPSSIDICGKSERRRFCRTQSGDDQNFLSASLECQVLQIVPDPLTKTGCCKKQTSQPAEKGFAQHLVRMQAHHQQFVCFRHVEVCCRGNLSEITNCLREQLLGWPTLIDVQGSAVEENDPKVMAAAKGMVPGQPIAEHRRLVY